MQASHVGTAVHHQQHLHTVRLHSPTATLAGGWLAVPTDGLQCLHPHTCTPVRVHTHTPVLRRRGAVLRGRRTVLRRGWAVLRRRRAAGHHKVLQDRQRKVQTGAAGRTALVVADATMPQQSVCLAKLIGSTRPGACLPDRVQVRGVALPVRWTRRAICWRRWTVRWGRRAAVHTCSGSLFSTVAAYRTQGVQTAVLTSPRLMHTWEYMGQVPEAEQEQS